MTTIKGTKALTITVTAGETYEIQYGYPATVNVANHTDNAVRFGVLPEFTVTDNVGQFVEIDAGSAYNGYCPVYDPHGALTLYVQADADGKISITEGE